MRKILSFVLLLGLAYPSFSQQIPVNTPANKSLSPAAEPGSNKSDGIELPSDQTVKYDEGFVTLTANCKGSVKWLVLCPIKIKYFTLPSQNSIIISVPPQDKTKISVFAVGLIDGKLTEFVRTDITVTGGPSSVSNINPTPVSMHVTFVVDLNNTNQTVGQILNSQKIREAITTRNSYYRLYDSQSSVLKEKGLDKIVLTNGGAPLIIVQSSSGAVMAAKKMPGTEAEVLQFLTQILGGQ